ncbi:YjeF family protein [Rhodobacteraceae bacterium KLH11]|nr:YjeF family protein [Rhodobacteraceae bacterium KLH11]
MTELLTAGQMRAVEQTAIKSGAVTGLELMERAGQGVVDAIFEEWPELDRRGASPSRSPEYFEKDEEVSRRVVVLCGPGNNGGDGFVVARLLHGLGWQVEAFLYGDVEKLPPDARVNYERWIELGRVRPFGEAPTGDCGAALYVDALFGTGLQRPLTGEVLAWAVARASEPQLVNKTVSVDIPSGLCADSGRDLAGEAETVRAGLTVSFHTAKPGHYLGHGPARSGCLVVRDIGLTEPVEGAVRLVSGEGIEFGKAQGAHKYSHGHALVLAGGPGKTGAARLAARGALRIGAGLVTLGVPPAAQMEVACQITALMLQRVDGPEGLSDLLQDDRLNALCLGPGLGLACAAELVPVALAAKRPTVLDADALTALAETSGCLMAELHEECVLTPHGGEFSRLFPDIAEKLAAVPGRGPGYSKVDAVRAAAARAGCVVLLKGSDTVIAAPDGRCAINAASYERAAPWLATAGSGDVLAGFITGLLARGFAPMQAAEAGAWLHVECARQFGPGLIAEDLPEQVPILFNKSDIRLL